MADVSKSLVQQQFGPNASHYRVSPVHAVGASLQRLVEAVGPRDHWAALDVATGAGHTAAAFAPLVSTVVAADLTPEMLLEVAKLARDRGLANLRTAAADAENLPFDDGSFDLVTCRIAPHHFGDIPQFLSEVHRVLRPGGVFGLVDNVSPDTTLLPGFSDDDVRQALATYNAWEAERDPSHVRTLSTREWDDGLARANFKTRHAELIEKRMDFAIWCQNMSCPDETVQKLAAMLHAAMPALTTFLKPGADNGRESFSLFEYLVVADKV
jgi:ubiquinone/menaquinone biosynthesis C-methylase UbiE